MKCRENLNSRNTFVIKKIKKQGSNQTKNQLTSKFSTQQECSRFLHKQVSFPSSAEHLFSYFILLQLWL